MREHPSARDERGLLRAHAARSRLASLDGDPRPALLALYADLVQDHTAHDQRATASLKLDVEERLATAGEDSAELAALRALDRERARARRYAALADVGLLDLMLADSGPRVRSFELPRDPLDTRDEPRTCVVRRLDPPPGAADAGGPERAAAGLELDVLAQRALERPELASHARLGFATAVAGPARVLASVGAEPHELRGEPVARAPLAVAGVEGRAHALDVEGFLAGERRRFVLTAALAGGRAPGRAGRRLDDGARRDARGAARCASARRSSRP